MSTILQLTHCRVTTTNWYKVETFDPLTTRNPDFQLSTTTQTLLFEMVPLSGHHSQILNSNKIAVSEILLSVWVNPHHSVNVSCQILLNFTWPPFNLPLLYFFTMNTLLVKYFWPRVREGKFLFRQTWFHTLWVPTLTTVHSQRSF